MQVLVVDQADQFGMAAAIIEIELDQTPDRRFGFEMGEIECALAAAQALIDPLERSKIETRPCCRNNDRSSACWRARGGQSHRRGRPTALGGKLVLRGRQDRFARAVADRGGLACAMFGLTSLP